MNEYVIIYQAPNFAHDRKAIEDFFQSQKFDFKPLGETWPHIVHVDSELTTGEFAKTLRSHPMNAGAILFSINQTVHV
jgi:hypothetical protein